MSSNAVCAQIHRTARRIGHGKLHGALCTQLSQNVSRGVEVSHIHSIQHASMKRCIRASDRPEVVECDR